MTADTRRGMGEEDGRRGWEKRVGEEVKEDKVSTRKG